MLLYNKFLVVLNLVKIRFEFFRTDFLQFRRFYKKRAKIKVIPLGY